MDTTIQILMKEWPIFIAMMCIAPLIINKIAKKPLTQIILSLAFAYVGVLFLHSLYFGG